jgi:chaperonin GroEL
MATRKVKSTAKKFISNSDQIRDIVVKTMTQISDIVGSTLGPSGRVCLIESDFDGIPNKNTKDGVTVFNALGAHDPYQHLIIEQTRDAASRTASEAGDGTTTATVLSAALTKNLLAFCDSDKKFSPQRVVRIMNRLLKKELLPYIEKNAIKITSKNQDLLKKVATISANGDEEMADAVIQAFEVTGMSSNSHVTIQEIPGPGTYNVKLIEGLPIPMGYEESVGKFHNVFINDQSNLRVVLEKPLFILYDGVVNDLMPFEGVLYNIGQKYAEGGPDSENYKNVVIVAHGFGENAINQLAFNWPNPASINIMPFVTPMTQIINSRANFLADMAAFTGAKVFGIMKALNTAEPGDFGANMDRMEIYRFKATVVGDPDQMNIEVRVDQLRKQAENPESAAASYDLKERIGKLTSGIAKLEIYAGSAGELKEKHDRAEDAVCAVRAAINHGALPGGCRVLTDLSAKMYNHKSEDQQEMRVARDVLAPSLATPLQKLLDNAGYTEDEIEEIMTKLLTDRGIVYDVEAQAFGKAIDLGVFDARPAVEEALKNAMSIASVMGVMGGLVVHPRDEALERDEASKELAYKAAVDNPHQFENEANNRA